MDIFWLIVAALGVIQGSFLAAVVLVRENSNPLAARCYVGLALTCATMIFGDVVVSLTAGLIQTFVVYVNINTELLAGPAVVMLVRFLANPDRGMAWADWRWFSPWLGGVFLWQTLLWLGPPPPAVMDRLVALFVFLKAAYLYVCLITAYDELDRHGRRFVAGSRVTTIAWLKRWLVAFGVATGTIYATFFARYGGLAIPVDPDQLASLVVTVIVFWLSWMLMMRPRLLSQWAAAADQSEYARERRRLSRELADQRSYLDPDLSMARLAAHLGWTEARLSKVINEGFGTTFHELLNRYRLQHFERLARKRELQDRSVLTLAFDSGFNSKSSFYRVFAQQHGQTPVAFRKSASAGSN